MKHLFFIPLAAVLLTFSSCKKNEACIDGPSEVIVGSSVTYSFCGEGKNVTWNVYDGISTEEYEGEEITITFEMATEFAQIQLQADGGMLKGDDDVILAVKVSHGGYKLKITDSQFSNGNTNIETIAGATVDLYPSNTCWESEASSCLIASGTADNSGVVLFEGLDAGTYVADVRGYDVHANWSSNVRDMEVTFEESDLYTDYHDQVYVDFNGNYLLSKPTKWQLTDVILDGASIWSIISDCSKDNYLEFNKDFTWSYKEGSNVCSQSGESTGTLDRVYMSNYPITDPVSVYLSTISGSFEVSNASIISDYVLATDYYYTDPGTGNQFHYRYEFTKQD